jgi:hypothetical protein
LPFTTAATISAATASSTTNTTKPMAPDYWATPAVTRVTAGDDDAA